MIAMMKIQNAKFKMEKTMDNALNLSVLFSLSHILVLVFGACFLLILNVFTKFNVSLNVALSGFFLILSIAFSIYTGQSTQNEFFYYHLIISVSAFFLIILFGGAKFNKDVSINTQEFYPLFLLMNAGFLFMISTNLLIILVGLEIGSLALVSIIALNDRQNGIEAGIKYFIMGVMASVLYIFGVAVLYYAYGTIDISLISKFIGLETSIGLDTTSAKTFFNTLGFVYIGIIFLIVALGFKASLIPFHTWMADVYEGANAIVAGAVSIIPKIAVFAIIAILFSGLAQDNILKNEIWTILIVLTITIPNIAALIQTDIKRMMAYSSISHSGFVLSIFLFKDMGDVFFIYRYWILFSIANIGFFGLLWLMGTKNESYELDRFNGMVKFAPIPAFLFAIFTLSLAGIPPLSLFWGKISYITSALEANNVFMAIVLALNSAIAVVYYLKIVVAMFLKDPNEMSLSHKKALRKSSFSAKVIIFIMAVACATSVFWINFCI